MTAPLTQNAVRRHFVAACMAELDALKPGNVHRFAPGHSMQCEDFERAAEAAAPHIADPGLTVGERILRATEASFAATGMNTNLGIVLLCAPLAAAAQTRTPALGLRRTLAALLASLNVDDARKAYAAIRLANPAGLGEVEDGDVNDAGQTLTLTEAMYLAKDRDRIANAYVTAYADIFDFALPLFDAARADGATFADATTALHMQLLAEFPDSHIARKHGTAAALQVRDAARALRAAYMSRPTDATRARLLEFDRQLKSDAQNPGTTADFVVATLFTNALLGRPWP